MRHGTAGRRLRNRGSSGGGGGGGNGGGGSSNNIRRSNGGGTNRNQVFDSNGPDVRIRGTAFQIQEKYATLAKDSASMGDQVMAESYLQHAEHYQRIIIGWGDQTVGFGQQPAAQFEEDESEDGRSLQDRRYDLRPRQQQQPQQQNQPQPGLMQTVQHPSNQPQPSQPPVVERTDLGLPASILGEAVRKPELTEG
jgi:hypothetical protein